MKKCLAIIGALLLVALLVGCGFPGEPMTDDMYPRNIYFDGTNLALRSDGTIGLASLADAAAPNNSLYFSTDQNKAVYKDGAGVVHDLW